MVEDRKTGRQLIFTLRPEFMNSIRDLPGNQREQAGRRVTALPDDAIFQVEEKRISQD